MSSPHDAPAAQEGHDGHLDPLVDEGEPALESGSGGLGVLIWPAIIALIVAALLLPLVIPALGRGGSEAAEGEGGARPDAGEVTTPPPPAISPTTITGGPGTGTVIPLPSPSAPAVAPSNIVPTGTALVPTATAVPPTDTPVPATDTVGPASPAPTQALPPVVSDPTQGALQQLEFGGQTFRVEPAEIVQDWQFSDQPGVASWISGTVFNYIVGLPYSPANLALFSAAQKQDTVRLKIAAGDVLPFRVTDTPRVPVTDTTLLAQDHPGVTLLLLGGPGTLRQAVVGVYAP